MEEQRKREKQVEKSYFDGTVLQHFGYSLLAGMFTAITFGIGAPWAYCGLHRWEVKHTVIESKRLEFDGTGLQLFLLVLKLVFLPILVLIGAMLIFRPFAETEIGPVVAVLIGLPLLVLSIFYGSFVVIQTNKWIVCHTHFQIHILPDSSEVAFQAASTYDRAAPAPQPAPYRPPEKDWADKITPALPWIYVLWFCGIAAGTFFLLSLIFK